MLMKIAGKGVGDDCPVFVIAEIGSNHGQSLEQAKRLIKAAADTGADAAKFQYYKATDLYPPDSPVFGAVKATELPDAWLDILDRYASDCGIIFMASVFGLEGAKRLECLKIKVHKLASSEVTKQDLLIAVAKQRRPVIMSTAMCDLADVYEAVEVLTANGADEIALLQCTAIYPTPPEKVNLAVMDVLSDAFGLVTGYSDHTLGIEIPLAAVARGAKIVEKHLTLDRELPGPDHFYALEPDEFKAMVEGIRNIEKSIGSSAKKILPEEGNARRLSIRCARPVAQGDIITDESIVFGRPGDGLRPRYKAAITGRRAVKDITAGEAFTWSMLD